MAVRLCACLSRAHGGRRAARNVFQSGAWRAFSGENPVPLVREGPKPDVNLQKKEALRLYRDVIRSARHFTWTDKDGIPWRDKLITSARKEFEDARHERDPEIIARLLIGGQDALITITDRMLMKARKLVDEEAKAAASGASLGDGWVGNSSDTASGGGSAANIPFGAGPARGQGSWTRDGQRGGVGKGAIPFGAGQERTSGVKSPGMGQKEGQLADRLAWKQDWQKRHANRDALNGPLKSPWSTDR